MDFKLLVTDHTTSSVQVLLSSSLTSDPKILADTNDRQSEEECLLELVVLTERGNLRRSKEEFKARQIVGDTD